MNHIQKTMHRYLEEIAYCIDNGNKKGVISLMNEMKNFYMTEEGLKKKKESKKLSKPDPEDEIFKTVTAVGKFDNITEPQPKTIKHVFY